MQHTIKVHNVPCEVTTHRKSKSVWAAVGEYHGERVEGEGKSESIALKRWHEAASYRGN